MMLLSIPLVAVALLAVVHLEVVGSRAMRSRRNGQATGKKKAAGIQPIKRKRLSELELGTNAAHPRIQAIR